jgi:hypothetical protein
MTHIARDDFEAQPLCCFRYSAGAGWASGMGTGPYRQRPIMLYAQCAQPASAEPACSLPGHAGRRRRAVAYHERGGQLNVVRLGGGGSVAGPEHPERGRRHGGRGCRIVVSAGPQTVPSPASGMRSTIRTNVAFWLIPNPAPNTHMPAITAAGTVGQIRAAMPREAIASPGPQTIESQVGR